MANTTGTVTSGAFYALGNLAVFSRVSGKTTNDDSDQMNNDAGGSSGLNTSGATFNQAELEKRHTNALVDLTAARKVNSQANNDLSSIDALLTDLQTKVTSFSNLVGKSGSINVTARTTLLSDINELALNINDEINGSTYQSEPIFGGAYSTTYDNNGQLKFNTNLFGGNDLTVLPNYLSLRPQEETIGLGSANDQSFTVAANGVELTEDATSTVVSDFLEQLIDARAQIATLQERVTARETFLNTRTALVTNTEIEPALIESTPLTQAQKVVAGLYQASDTLLHLNGIIVSIKA